MKMGHDLFITERCESRINSFLCDVAQQGEEDEAIDGQLRVWNGSME